MLGQIQQSSNFGQYVLPAIATTAWWLAVTSAGAVKIAAMISDDFRKAQTLIPAAKIGIDISQYSAIAAAATVGIAAIVTIGRALSGGLRNRRAQILKSICESSLPCATRPFRLVQPKAILFNTSLAAFCAPLYLWCVNRE